MNDHIIIRSAEAAGLELNSYSGRGMYGKRCVAIETDGSEANIIVALVRGVRDVSRDEADLNSLLEHIEDMQVDSMGRGIVVYWPNVEAPADEED